MPAPGVFFYRGARRAIEEQKASCGNEALPSTLKRMKFNHKTLETADIEKIHKFIQDADIVEGPDDLWLSSGQSCCIRSSPHDP